MGARKAEANRAHPRLSVRDRPVHRLVLLGASLAFHRIVVVRYRIHLETRGLAANTISQQLAAVRRLAYEAADAGLLTPETSRRHWQGKWCEATRVSPWKLAESGPELGNKLADLDIDEVQTREGHWAMWFTRFTRFTRVIVDCCCDSA
jgi:hypothetical protein